MRALTFAVRSSVICSLDKDPQGGRDALVLPGNAQMGLIERQSGCGDGGRLQRVGLPATAARGRIGFDSGRFDDAVAVRCDGAGEQRP
ncbi:hypothetical protein ABIE00_002645 [Arthrobacter sp. OAP107]